MIFFDQPPSKEWATLKYKGEKFAEVWFKPEGEPFALTFRIPHKSFQTPGISQLLTIENLLKAVNIVQDEVESWRKKDPLPRMEKYLMDRKLLTEEQKKELATGITAEIDAAVEFAEQSPFPAMEEAPNFVWAEEK